MPMRHMRRGEQTHLAMDGCLALANDIPAVGTPAGDEAERGLILRAQRGERDAFDELVRLHDQHVLRLVTKVVGSPEEARDLYQEAFLKVYRSLARFRFDSRFSTWLYRVVVNVCYDHLRRRKSRDEVQAPAAREGEPEYFHMVPDNQPDRDPERALRSGEIRERLGKALARLAPRERMVFELRHFQGLKLRAIGDLCGTSEETAKNSLFRATQKLRLELGDLI
jgi:RNA polymerase sigma-70 factor, ECF subfamily